MKIFKFLIISLIFCSCLSIEKKQNIVSQSDPVTVNDIKGVVNFYIQNMALKAKLTDPIRLYPTFVNNLEDSIIFYTLINVDTFLNEENIEYMLNQYDTLSKVEISPYLRTEYKELLTRDYNIGDPISFFEISAPMFTKDKKHVILYTVIHFRSKNQTVWDNSFVVLMRSGSIWLYEGLIKKMDDKSVRFIKNKLKLK